MLAECHKKKEEHDTCRTAQKIIHWMKVDVGKKFKQEHHDKWNDDEQKSISD